MEANTTRRSIGLREKIPDIQKTLETVKFLKLRKVCSSLTRCDKIHITRTAKTSPLKTTYFKICAENFFRLNSP